MVALIIILVIIAIVAICAIRTKNFVPKPVLKREKEEIKFNKEQAIDNLARLVKAKTISYKDTSLENKREFEKFYKLLPELYPNVYKKCALLKFKNKGLVFHWKGKQEGDPAIFMAHYDVVPVNEDLWQKPAFEAIIEDGVMWGRGTLDTKITFNGIMTAAENLIKKGFKPEYDIYFAFDGTEETTGAGAYEVEQYFKEMGITPALVIDEGGAVVKDIFPGVKESCGLIGIAEKGMMNVEFNLKSGGGHASAPAPHTPVGILAKACRDVENHPFKMHLKGPASQMFDTLGRYSSTLYRVIFANLWLFSPVLDILCKKKGGELNALVRTTCAFTMMKGSVAPNVVPPEASLGANMRLNPSDTTEKAIKYLNKVVNNKDIKISKINGGEPSRVSRTDVAGYRYIKEAIEDTWEGTIVSPYLMVQCSDSRFYSELSDRVYRFSAMDLTAEERRTIHGNNERVRLETICSAVEFFMRVMKNC